MVANIKINTIIKVVGIKIIIGIRIINNIIISLEINNINKIIFGKI